MKLINLLIFLFLITGIEKNCYSQYQVGDTLQFWSVTYIDWPPLQGVPQRVVNATCKKAGEHCYVFVENSAIQPLQLNIDLLVQKFDEYFYDSLTNRYGPVPDVLDNDSNIFILVLDEPNWAGYFDPAQQMSDSMVFAKWNKHSTQREIIYVAANYFDIYSEYVVSHEFGHLLHWLQDHSPEPPANPVVFWEEAFVDEGFSTFAQIYLQENIYQHNVFDYQAFFANDPDNSLIYFSDYNEAKLFILFMFEHYGKWNYISSLISNQLNGICGIDSTLNVLGYNENFDDAFEQWIIANYVDDSVYAGGKYSYAHYTFPPCYVSSNYTSFPTGLKNAIISPYGADYITFKSVLPNPLILDFQGQTDSKFRIDFILKNSATNHIDSIISIPLDSTNHGSFITNGLGTIYNEVIMAVMNIDSTIHANNYASYTYSATPYSEIEDNVKENRFIVFPNPANDKLFISSVNNDNSFATIKDLEGRVILNKQFANKTSIDISELSKGIYILQVISDENLFKEIFIKE